MRLPPLLVLALAALGSLLLPVALPRAVVAQALPILVSTEWLAERIGEEGLVILHVGSEASFLERHIPGARHMPLQAFAPEIDGMSTELPEAEVIRRVLEAAGVSSDSRIVVYSATHPPQLAARLYLTLDHFGLGEQSALLDGGIRTWEAEGREVGTGSMTVAPGTLHELTAGEKLIVDHTYVHARAQDGAAVIVDARDPGFWTGEEQSQARAARPGRIPGARNVPFRTLVDESGHVLALDELAILFQAAGVESGRPIVAYCHVGQQASLLVVAARLLGHEATLYDGSYEDWSHRPELPVVTE
jgi:thiosulfate/3-mercaptopyruvate sulfurtransferase